jgi:hypothetical protein
MSVYMEYEDCGMGLTGMVRTYQVTRDAAGGLAIVSARLIGSRLG